MVRSSERITREGTRSMPACMTACVHQLTSMRLDTILRGNMLRRALILLLAVLVLVLPLVSVSVQAGGCCGAGSNRESKASETDSAHKTVNAHKTCCCGDVATCTCHLSEDQASPSTDAVPVSTNTDPRSSVIEVYAGPAESIPGHFSSDPVPSLARFAYARAPSSDIYVLNHIFLC
jgi:hypothetical protein